jgi:hypothetical protein
MGQGHILYGRMALVLPRGAVLLGVGGNPSAQKQGIGIIKD